MYEVITIFHANVEAALLSLSDRDLITTLFSEKEREEEEVAKNEKKCIFSTRAKVALEQYFLTTIAS